MGNKGSTPTGANATGTAALINQLDRIAADYILTQELKNLSK